MRYNGSWGYICYRTSNLLRIHCENWFNSSLVLAKSLHRAEGGYRQTFEAYYMCRYVNKKTRNSAIADKPRDAFRGQSKSPNMVPFHVLGIVSY